jgi:hypothetical protein
MDLSRANHTIVASLWECYETHKVTFPLLTHLKYLTNNILAFHEFIHERELHKGEEPSIQLFDQIILSKKNRGARSTFRFSKASTNFLSDTSDHIWRTAVASPPSARFPGDYRQIISRIPASLDPTLMKEPRIIQGVPRRDGHKQQRRKPVVSLQQQQQQQNQQQQYQQHQPQQLL